jgi:hypothetical protein
MILHLLFVTAGQVKLISYALQTSEMFPDIFQAPPREEKCF